MSAGQNQALENAAQAGPRIGVFGGSFDPPHAAHVALAKAAVEQLKLDELRIVPTGDAWHKKRTLSPAADRLAMAELAFAGLPHVQVDARELRRSGPSYTIDTLEALHTERPGSAMFLVIGQDQLQAFTHWHRWQDILRLACLCVVNRPVSTGLDFDSAPRTPARTADSSAVPQKASKGASRGASREASRGPQSLAASTDWPEFSHLVQLTMPPMAVSATAIRQCLASSEHTASGVPASDPRLDSVLPQAVARYISLHGLYQAPSSS